MQSEISLSQTLVGYLIEQHQAEKRRAEALERELKKLTDATIELRLEPISEDSFFRIFNI